MDLSSLGADAEKHEKLIRWAIESGVFIDGVMPTKLPNKGLGIVATRAIEKGEMFIRVPRDASLRVDPDKKVFNKGFEECSVHGRVARRLFAKGPDGARQYATYVDAMPSFVSLKREMPCLWDDSLRNFLPDKAKELLDHQIKKMNTDLEQITNAELKSQASSSAELSQLRDEYRHAWLLVNTRCFYWDYPDLRKSKSFTKAKQPRPQFEQKQKQRPRDDCMALNPFVDYFNHSSDDEIVTVSFNRDGFEVRARRDIESGEELHVSYGKHSNDFLLVEYGFMIPGNEDDNVKIDSWVLPMLSTPQKELLDQLGFLGDYTISVEDLEICYRTQTALRSLVASSAQVEAHVHGVESLADENPRKGSKKGGKILSELEIQKQVGLKTKDLLHRAKEDTEKTIMRLKNEGEGAYGETAGVRTLVVRWEEILSILTRTASKLA